MLILVRFDNQKRAKLGREDDWSSNSSSDSEKDGKKNDSSEDSSSSSESELSLSETEESSDDPDDDFNPFGNGSDSDEGMYYKEKVIAGIVASAFKSTVVLFCAFFLWLAFFDGLECFLCFFSRVSAFFCIMSIFRYNVKF